MWAGARPGPSGATFTWVQRLGRWRGKWEGWGLTGTGGDKAQGSGLSHVHSFPGANCFSSTLASEALWPRAQGYGGL